MPQRSRTSMIGWLCFAAGLFLLGRSGVSAPAEQAGYSPVVSPPPLHAFLQSNLKLVQGWLDDKDYVSAAEATQGLVTLAQLYAYQGAEPAWQRRCSALQEECSRLMQAARRKSAADCEKSTRECGRLLEELAKTPPAGDKARAENFKTPGSTKTMMLLMDGAYADAKSSRKTAEVEQLAQAIAELSNASAHLRREAAWKQATDEVRDLALKAAGLARGDDPAPAKVALKEMYRRCEKCHTSYKR